MVQLKKLKPKFKIFSFLTIFVLTKYSKTFYIIERKKIYIYLIFREVVFFLRGLNEDIDQNLKVISLLYGSNEDL